MTAEQLRNAVESRPFRPFVLHMANGRTAEVPHADFISVHPNGRTTVVHTRDGASSILDTMLITEIQYATADP
jgi:hypothetical protein